MFFDIKPNGDFWICQDHPAKSPLNILDPDFPAKYRQADVSHQRACSGRAYSCHFVTRKAFEPRNWPQMAVMWLKSTTRPDEPCRKAAKERGWAVGLGHFCASRLASAASRSACALVPFFLLSLFAGRDPARAQVLPREDVPQDIVARMEQLNAQRRQALGSYQNRRRYAAATSFLHWQSYLLIEESFKAPQEKQLRIVERGGSRTIEQRVFKPLIDAELANNRSTSSGEVDFCRANYKFTPLGLDDVAKAYVFQIVPRRPDKFLLRGKLWVNAQDLAIQRVEGEPAGRLSFWIRRNRLVHEYAKFGDFWFPVRTSSEVDLRLFGHATLEIDYFDYAWQPRVEPVVSAVGRQEKVPQSASPQRRSDSPPVGTVTGVR